MKLFSGESVEVVLTPTNQEMISAVETAKKLMSIKINNWILDQLTVEQLNICIKQFQAELQKRGEL